MNDSNFGKIGKSQFVWLGMNSAKQTGTYIIDNSRPPAVIDWFNWDQDSDENDSGLKNSIQMIFSTGAWFRTIGNDFAAAVCSKPIL